MEPNPSGLPAGKGPAFSVVVPVYQCAGCLEALCDRLEAVLSTLTGRYEIILVDDRSTDGSWEKIVALQPFHPALHAVRLSRNFGQHIAITAGLESARGDVVVVMDCDLQDPPEKIPELYARFLEGHDVVMARRITRSHPGFRVAFSRLYLRLFGNTSNERMDGSYGSFSLLSRKVVEAFLRFGERERHYLFILRWLGFRIGSIDYEHQQRLTGVSSYSLARLLRHALDGIFFQTTVFLRWIVGFGFLFAFCGATFALFLILRWFYEAPLPGWTSLAVVMLLNTGAILTSLGMVGLYIGKIFDQIKARPLYIVDTVVERKTRW
jgi:dolichol-phosphate mannosyltransferase